MARSNRRTPDVHLNLNVRGMPPSATLAINERANALRQSGREVFKLGLGQSPFPVPDCVVEALKEHAFEKDYLPVRGLDALRDSVAAYYRRSQGMRCRGEDVLIGPGSKELMFLLQLVYYGDLVIPTPAWVSYAPQARIIGRKVRMLQTRAEDGWCLHPDSLEQLCAEDPLRPRIVLLNYPANPTGGSYGATELEALAEVARRHRAVVLSDEIYGELHFRGDHTSIARFYPEGTLVSGGLSKWCGAGGWRLGTLVVPRRMQWLLDAMAAVASETFTATSAPIQYAAVRAFEGGDEIEAYLRRSRRVLDALSRWVVARLRAAGLELVEPRGAFYVFPDFALHAETLAARGIETSPALCERLLADTGVAILPGSDFGCSDGELTARLSLVDFDGAGALAAAEGCEELSEPVLRSCCGRVLAAVEALCAWLVTSTESPVAPD